MKENNFHVGSSVEESAPVCQLTFSQYKANRQIRFLHTEHKQNEHGFKVLEDKSQYIFLSL